jgi:hypothetical protein
MTELALPLGFCRGLSICATALALGTLEDVRLARTGWPHLGLMVVTGLGLLLGLIAVGYAWLWAGSAGPVHRLTSRACGVAFGYLIPALVASHGLYFHWVDLVEEVCGQELQRLYSLFL